MSRKRGEARVSRRRGGAQTFKRTVTWIVTLGIAALLGLVGYGWLRQHPQDTPWAPLDLAQPVGLFTRAKLVALGDDFPQCRALLDRAGIEYAVLPKRREGAACGYADAIRFAPGEPRLVPFAPANLGIACPVAAALTLWEWTVVQAAAQRHLGQKVAQIEHLGSYNCRRLYGRATGDFSEHATADAIDIADFRLADGTRITVLRDWPGDDPRARFLHDVRDGACGVFATVLSPDYNAAHRDHLHFDQARRGRFGGVCR